MGNFHVSKPNQVMTRLITAIQRYSYGPQCTQKPGINYSPTLLPYWGWAVISPNAICPPPASPTPPPPAIPPVQSVRACVCVCLAKCIKSKTLPFSSRLRQKVFNRLLWPFNLFLYLSPRKFARQHRQWRKRIGKYSGDDREEDSQTACQLSRLFVTKRN